MRISQAGRSRQLALVENSPLQSRRSAHKTLYQCGSFTGSDDAAGSVWRFLSGIYVVFLTVGTSIAPLSSPAALADEMAAAICCSPWTGG